MDFNLEKRLAVTNPLSNWLIHQVFRILLKEGPEGVADMKTYAIVSMKMMEKMF